MKLSSVLILATASLLLAACNSLDNPITNFFHSSNRDERVYNPQTGEWEWPAGKPTPRPNKSAAVAGALATPAPNDTRYWDASHNQWVQQEQPRSASSSKTKPSAPPAESADAASAPSAPAPPPPPRAAHATGVYNASTGKIEWQDSDANVPRGAVAPEPKKHWYWPF
ncbi:MAG: hypothetical protein P4L99_20710 [Chthoniobacter sp.]|nr:hypothetical protein [Chthoniobacter sp.]